MQMRQLGKTGIEIAPLVFGGNVFGWTVNADESFRLLDAFVDRGFSMIDTADVYSRWAPGNQGGESETILGEWLRRSGKRDKIVLATKVGMDMGHGREGLGKQYILDAAEASLRRLGVETIDLYQSHKDDAATPIDASLEAYQQLIEQGKVRAIGASNFKGARLTEAIETAEREGLPTYSVLQPEYNLLDRQDYETDLAPVAERFSLGIIPYFSLASGFLTGKYHSLADTEGVTRGSRVTKYFNDRGTKVLAALDQVAKETGAKQATVALAWLMAQPTITAPIASATKVEQLGELMAAVELRLSDEQLGALTAAGAYEPAHAAS